MLRYMMLLSISLLFAVIPAEGAVVINVTEDSDVVLPCSLSSKENLEFKLFDWKKDVEKEGGKDVEKRVFMYDGGLYSGRDSKDQDQQFEGRVSHFPEELKNGNASIKISKTKVSDSGSYSCIFPRLQPRQTFSVQLVVDRIYKDRFPENRAASSKPYVRTLHETEDWALLLCEVQGVFPEPKLEWRDSSGNILPAEERVRSLVGDKYFVILQTTVTKTGNYSCVLRQEDLKHEIDAQTFVHLHGNECSLAPVVVGCLAAGWLAGAVTLATGQFLAVKNRSAWRYKVIDYLSKLKPQRDSKQQNGNCMKNGSITKDAAAGPADQPDPSEVLLQSPNVVLTV